MKRYQFYVLEHQNTSYGDIEIVDKKYFSVTIQRSRQDFKFDTLIRSFDSKRLRNVGNVREAWHVQTAFFV